MTAAPQWQDAISQIFMNLGITGLEIVDPTAFRDVLEQNRYLDYTDDGFIESFGEDVVIRAYFHGGNAPEIIERQLKKAFNQYNINPMPKIEICLRDDFEWKDNWKHNFKTFFISKRVIIKPSWETCCLKEGQIVIELDPGMAFGTGTHETTRMCALFLDDLITGNESVLDLGCGTGILGIIAAKLGASDVVCVDIDEAACSTAKDNIQNNNVGKSITVISGELKDLEHRQYDIIIINIVANIILALLPGLKEYCKPTSNVILSGIIKERRQEVLNTAALYGFRPAQEQNEGEWVAIRLCTGF